MSKMGDSGNTGSGCKTGWIQGRIDIGYETGRKQNRFAVGQDEKAGAVDPHSFSILDPDPHSICRSGSGPGGKNLREKTEKMQGSW